VKLNLGKGWLTNLQITMALIVINKIKLIGLYSYSGKQRTGEHIVLQLSCISVSKNGDPQAIRVTIKITTENKQW